MYVLMYLILVGVMYLLPMYLSLRPRERAGYTKAHDSRKGSVAQQVRYRGPHNARAEEAEGNGDVRE